MSVKDFTKELRKQYGKDTVTTLEGNRVLRIPTGIFNLDAETGGGIPYGQFSLFGGQFQGGKSLTALRTACNAQQLDRETHAPLVVTEAGYTRPDGTPGHPMRVLYLDPEGTVSLQWAATVGVDINPELFVHAYTSSLEETYNILHGAISSGEFDLIVLDSIAAMAPNAEIDAAAEDQQMGVAARGNNRGIRVAQGLMNRAKKATGRSPAIILVNQIRESMAMYSGPVFPGGKGQMFASALTVEFRPQNSKDVKIKDEVIARASAWKISKNKLNGKTGIQGEFLTYITDHGPYRKGDTNSITQVLVYALKLGLAEKSGAWYTVNGVSGLQGENQAVDYLITNPDYYAQLKAEVEAAL